MREIRNRPRRSRTTRTLMIMALMTWVSSASSEGQVGTQTIDPRNPVELAYGTDADQDLMLIGAIFESPNQISVFSGPGGGQGPFVEEIAASSGASYFALSREIHCRDRVCYFTAVNGFTQNVELFIRATNGTWIRRQITNLGISFNSDLCLNKGTVTVLAYDAVNAKHEIWRGSESDLVFTKSRERLGSADAIFGALRASIACDPRSFDFWTVLEDEQAPAPVGAGAEDLDPTPGGMPRLSWLWAERGGVLSEIPVSNLLIPLSGLPADGRESRVFRLTDFKVLIVEVDENGRVVVSVFDPLVDSIEFRADLGAVTERTSLSATSISMNGHDLVELRSPPDFAISLVFDAISCSLIATVREDRSQWNHQAPAVLGPTTGPSGNPSLGFVSTGSVLLRRYEGTDVVFANGLETGDPSAWSAVVP